MRLLVLGGTAFVGQAVVTDALARGVSVTTFNRGRTGEDVIGVRPVRGDRLRPDDIAALVAQGPWDAVIDTSGYVPRNVLAVARALEPVTGHCVFVSTVSAYAGWPNEALTEASSLLKCPPDAGPDYGVDVEDGPTRYGYQKAGCEAAALEVFGKDRVTVLRPGVVLGPREYVGRLPWWLLRIAAGGTVIAPGDPERRIQPVDVRDLATFAVTAAERPLTGAFNVAAPLEGSTFGGLLAACAAVTGSSAQTVWAPDDVLAAAGVRQWSELPLWRTAAGVWRVDPGQAQQTGLRCRDLADTVADTWRWMSSHPSIAPATSERASEVGLTIEHERAVLRLLGRTVAPPL
ncbi:NAD-dependent epimerase/dehydratase family protein [Kineosporia sp. A_224]|uniref:NAD-dependent epimerase/dehydratase family protein n=1 Tax=Kineosporia sp. A_224 TaxID=1962180 RepID=UPI000B4A629A|nr:NAD-dependent epimerase/dehydratase family protein [Kineosporia sp. A_224]